MTVSEIMELYQRINHLAKKVTSLEDSLIDMEMRHITHYHLSRGFNNTTVPIIVSTKPFNTSDETTKNCITCGREISRGCDFYIGSCEEDKIGPFCSKCMDDELRKPYFNQKRDI